MDIVQLLALLGDPLGAEPLSVGALPVAGAVVAVGHFPVLANGDEALPPEADAGPLLQELAVIKVYFIFFSFTARHLYHRLSHVVPLLGSHVALLPDVVYAAGHVDAARGLAPQHRDHVAAHHVLNLASVKVYIMD